MELMHFKGIQSPSLVDLLVRQIVQSKRLLADHIEFLEQCHAIPTRHTDNSMNKSYTASFVGGLVLSSLAIASFNTKINCLRYLIPIAATTYDICFTVKTMFVIKDKLTERRLNETISKIDKADVAIRKNISFFRESKLLGSLSSERCHKHSEICLKSIIEIIRTIYAEVKLIESIPLPEHIEVMYEPLEELSTCIYFQKSIDQFTSDDIKAFHNIFLYFQSQYWMRLCVILLYAHEFGLKYLNNSNIQFQKSLEVHIEKLTDWLNQIVQQMAIQRNQSKFDVIKIGSDEMDLLKMKRSSMDILCRLIAATNQYQSTDQRIQSIDIGSKSNKKEMLNILNEMNRAKESLYACQDDFATLQLIYNKYLVQKFGIPIELKHDAETNQAPDSITDSERNVENVKPIVDEESKEYFAMRDIQNDEDSESANESADEPFSRADWQEELDNIDMKVTRSFFAPVLKQLKTKIDPIKSEMKERELKFLMSKGIDRDTIIEFDKNDEIQVHDSDSSDIDSDASADMYETRKKSKPKIDRFNEMRSFLEQKQPIRFLPLSHLPPSGEEDVLE